MNAHLTYTMAGLVAMILIALVFTFAIIRNKIKKRGETKKLRLLQKKDEELGGMEAGTLHHILEE